MEKVLDTSNPIGVNHKDSVKQQLYQEIWHRLKDEHLMLLAIILSIFLSILLASIGKLAITGFREDCKSARWLFCTLALIFALMWFEFNYIWSLFPAMIIFALTLSGWVTHKLIVIEKRIELFKKILLVVVGPTFISCIGLKFYLNDEEEGFLYLSMIYIAILIGIIGAVLLPYYSKVNESAHPLLNRLWPANMRETTDAPNPPNDKLDAPAPEDETT